MYETPPPSSSHCLFDSFESLLTNVRSQMLQALIEDRRALTTQVFRALDMFCEQIQNYWTGSPIPLHLSTLGFLVILTPPKSIKIFLESPNDEDWTPIWQGLLMAPAEWGQG